MPAHINVELRGALELLRKAEKMAAELSNGRQLYAAMQRATAMVAGTARRYAKRDRGLYVNSIVPSVEVHVNGIEGVVGSNREYAPFVVFDTRPHWPPRRAIEAWAHRHGIQNWFLVARAIARRGTKGDQSLIRGLNENIARIQRLIEDAVGRIVSQ